MVARRPRAAAARAELWSQAARLWQRLERPARAAASAAEAEEEAPESDRALLARARAHLAAHHHAAAAPLVARLLEGELDDELRAELEPVGAWLAATTPEEAWRELPLGRRLGGELSIGHPLLARQDLAAETLRFDAVGGADPLATLALRRTGGPVGIRLALRLQRLEWNGWLRLALRPPGDLVEGEPRFVVGCLGGAGGLETAVSREAHFPERDPEVRREQTPQDGATPGWLVELELVEDPAAGELAWRVRSPRLQSGWRSPWSPSGDAPLELVFDSPVTTSSSSLVRVEVERIALLGLEPASTTRPAAPVRPDGSALVDAPAAEAWSPAAWTVALRLHPARAHRALRRLEGAEEANRRFADAWLRAALGHGDDPRVQAAVTRSLDLRREDELLFGPLGLELLQERGRAWWALGAAEQAIGSLSTAAAHAEATGARDVCQESSALLAGVLVAEGRPDEALEQARRSMGCALLPDYGRERLERVPGVEGLVGEPGWGELLR